MDHKHQSTSDSSYYSRGPSIDLGRSQPFERMAYEHPSRLPFDGNLNLTCSCGNQATNVANLPTSLSDSQLIDFPPGETAADSSSSPQMMTISSHPTILESPMQQCFYMDCQNPSRSHHRPVQVVGQNANLVSYDHAGNDDNESTVTKISCRSLSGRPAFESDLASRVSSECSDRRRHSSIERRIRLTPQTSDSNYRRRRDSNDREGFEYGFIKLSPGTVEQVNQYRHMILIVIIATLYSTVAFCVTVARHMSSQIKTPHPIPTVFNRTEEPAVWTQEMIYGWYRERPLALSPDLSDYQKGSETVKVRECRSSVPLKKSMPNRSKTPMPLHDQTLGMSINSTAGQSTTEFTKQFQNDTATSTKRETKQRVKFEALNGCLYRLDLASDSTGDVCCCAGIPSYVMVPVADIYRNVSETNTTKVVTPSNSTSRVRREGISTLETKFLKGNENTTKKPAKIKNESIKMERLYLRPHIVCFNTDSASLFNPQRLLAPVATEYSIMHTFIKGKGRCITCSCCHEHDPARVNKVLANVPIDTPETLPVVVDSNGNHMVMSDRANTGQFQRSDSFWNRLRDRLVTKMRQLDDFFFWMFDVIQIGLFLAKNGNIPDNITDPTTLILMQNSLMPPVNQKHFSIADKDAPKSTKSPLIDQVERMYIDEDLYLPFAATSPMTSTTTVEPRSSRAQRRRQRLRANVSPYRTSRAPNSENLIKTTGRSYGNSSITSAEPSLIIKVFASSFNNTAPENSTSSTPRPSSTVVGNDGASPKPADGRINVLIELDKTPNNVEPKKPSKHEQKHRQQTSSKQVIEPSGDVSISELNVTTRTSTTTRTTDSLNGNILLDREETQTSSTNRSLSPLHPNGQTNEPNPLSLPEHNKPSVLQVQQSSTITPIATSVTDKSNSQMLISNSSAGLDSGKLDASKSSIVISLDHARSPTIRIATMNATNTLESVEGEKSIQLGPAGQTASIALISLAANETKKQTSLASPYENQQAKSSELNVLSPSRLSVLSLDTKHANGGDPGSDLNEFRNPNSSTRFMDPSESSTDLSHLTSISSMLSSDRVSTTPTAQTPHWSSSANLNPGELDAKSNPRSFDASLTSDMSATGNIMEFSNGNSSTNTSIAPSGKSPMSQMRADRFTSLEGETTSQREALETSQSNPTTTGSTTQQSDIFSSQPLMPSLLQWPNPPATLQIATTTTR